MDRNGIAGEGIHEEEIEILRRVPFQRKASVSQDFGNLGRRLGHEREVRLGDVEDLRVDLVETVVVALAAITKQRAAAETNDADLSRHAFGACQRSSAGAALAAKVAGGDHAAGGIEQLLPVVDP